VVTVEHSGPAVHHLCCPKKHRLAAGASDGADQYSLHHT
jgi:hypothetical protein